MSLLGGHPDYHGRSTIAQVRRWVYKNKPLSYWFIVVATLLGLDVLLKLWARLHAAPVDPLVNFQLLNDLPIVQSHPVTTRNERAVVTTMYTDTFAHGIATLGHSLQTVKTNARLILAYFPDRISPRALCIAKAGGWELHPIKRIAPPHNGKGIHSTFVDQYSKLSIWALDQIGIKSLVYLDGDTLVRKNFDEIWDLPYNFAAGPDVWTDSRGFVIGFNAGMLYLRPSTAVFNDMISKLETADYPLIWAEQAFLNLYFGGHALRLPFIYNGNVAIKEKSPVLWKSMERDMRIVHYTLAKPFPPYEGGLIEANTLTEHIEQEKVKKGLYVQELTWWENAWNDMRQDKKAVLATCDAQ